MTNSERAAKLYFKIADQVGIGGSKVQIPLIERALAAAYARGFAAAREMAAKECDEQEGRIKDEKSYSARDRACARMNVYALSKLILALVPNAEVGNG